MNASLELELVPAVTNRERAVGREVVAKNIRRRTCAAMLPKTINGLTPAQSQQIREWLKDHPESLRRALAA